MAYVRQHPEFSEFRMKVGISQTFLVQCFQSEKPKGIMNGTNRVFRLEHQAIRDSEEIFKDGMKMTKASDLTFTDGDYYMDHVSESVTVITFSEKQVPQEKSVLHVTYKYMR